MQQLIFQPSLCKKAKNKITEMLNSGVYVMWDFQGMAEGRGLLIMYYKPNPSGTNELFLKCFLKRHWNWRTLFSSSFQ